MIYVVTGLPGAGKTLRTLTWLKEKSEKEGRPVYYSGVKDLKLPWIEHEPTKWMELPPNAIMFIDEGQRIFRPRANGSQVPDYVSALETHRHQGLDIVIATQHPNLLDQNVRRLCGNHVHMMRIMGLERSKVHEWAQIKENCDKVRADSSSSTFVFPKDSYAFYHSAEVHTHRVRIPKQVYVLGACVLLLIGAGYRIYATRMAGQASAAQAQAQQGATSTASPAGPGSRSPREVMSPREYVESFTPRVPGLAYTAPAYDQVTKAVRAPYPAACVQSKSRCQCYTQQGTRLEVDKQLCEGIAQGGFFMAWDEKSAQPSYQPGRAVVQAQGPAEPLPGLINATPGYAPANSRPVADQVADGQALRHGKNNRIPGPPG